MGHTREIENFCEHGKENKIKCKRGVYDCRVVVVVLVDDVRE